MRRQKKTRKIRVADLFSGAGGMSLGFKAAFGDRLCHVGAYDLDPAASETYTKVFGFQCKNSDIVKLLADPKQRIPKADLVIGGPPCQGFSRLNKGRKGDSRRSLWRPYLEYVQRSGAKVFVMENVPELVKSEEFNEIKKTAEKMGFEVSATVLCAADFGVPQKRNRAFIVGSKIAGLAEVFPPLPTHADPLSPKKGRRIWRTVRDAIGDLPAPSSFEAAGKKSKLALHFRRNPTELSIRRYKAIPKEGMSRIHLAKNAPKLTPPCWKKGNLGGTDIFGRLWWDKPSGTIRTEFFKPEKGRFLHPVQHRPITFREAARLQAFPDGFRFRGTKVQIARQIGNAVPPPLAKAVAGCIAELFATKS